MCICHKQCTRLAFVLIILLLDFLCVKIMSYDYTCNGGQHRNATERERAKERSEATVQTHFTKAKAIEIRNILMVPHGQKSKDKFSLQSNRHFNFEYFKFYLRLFVARNRIEKKMRCAIASREWHSLVWYNLKVKLSIDYEV